MPSLTPAIRTAARVIGFIAILGIIVLVARSSLWYQVYAAVSAQNQRIKQTTERLQSYRPEDWRSLYASCVELCQKSSPSNTAIARDQWPRQLSELQPVNVWIRDDGLDAQWTGGFDEFNLSMHILKHDSQFNGSTCAAGIHIIDTREILPGNPYDKSADASSRTY